MAFKNLEEKFLRDENTIYGRFSSRDGIGGIITDQPYIEIKPNDANLPQLQNDTRLVPGQAYDMDMERIDMFLRSGKGMQWLDQQIYLQKRNPVSETQTYDTDSVSLALEPYKFPLRSTSSPLEEQLAGDVTQRSPDSVGRSGRMQISTSKRVIAKFNTSGRSRPRNISTALSGLNGESVMGSLGVNQRPEMDMENDGRYESLYSVYMWKEFLNSESGPLETSFKRLGNSIKNLQPRAALNSVQRVSGNLASFAGSIQNNANRIATFTTSISDFGRDLLNPVARRERGLVDLAGQGFNLINQANSIKFGLDNTDRPDGMKYFITGIDSADRYIPGSIDYNGSKPLPSVYFMDRYPQVYDEDIETAETTEVRLQKPKVPRVLDDIETTASPLGGILGLITKGATWVSNVAGQIAKIGNTVSRTATQIKIASYEQIENPAEDAMKFSGLSLRQRYLTDDRMAFVKNEFEIQKEKWLESVGTAARLGSPVMYGGGVGAGREISVDSRSKYKFNEVERDEDGNRSYFYDVVNNAPIVTEEDDGISLNKLIRNETGLINFYIFDCVNKKSIPLRAYINGLQQTVTPSYSEIPYIGRTERNIVYTGFKRDVSFSLKVYAFTREELNSIWKKTNYITSLAAPSTYDPNGFMVAPLTKLTLGSLFVNQPGYIRSMAIQWDDDTPWEIDYDMQVPMGATIQLTYSIIETHQMRAGEYMSGEGHSPYRFYAPELGTNVISKNTEISNAVPVTENAGVVPGETPGANRPVPNLDFLTPPIKEFVTNPNFEQEERIRAQIGDITRIVNSTIGLGI